MNNIKSKVRPDGLTFLFTIRQLISSQADLLPSRRLQTRDSERHKSCTSSSTSLDTYSRSSFGMRGDFTMDKQHNDEGKSGKKSYNNKRNSEQKSEAKPKHPPKADKNKPRTSNPSVPNFAPKSESFEAKWQKKIETIVVMLGDHYDFILMVTVVEFMQINKLSDKSDIIKLVKSYKKGDDVKANLLRDMVICGDCGDSMTAGITVNKSTNGKVIRYFYSNYTP